MSDIRVRIADWKYDAPFVYSITYDEATIDAVVNSYPIHEEFGWPGHVCAVTGYLGTMRMKRGTSMRDVFHMSAEQLRFLMSRGWTVSSHSHSHPPTALQLDLDLEVRVSKEELEQATGQPVRLFTFFNDLAQAEPIRAVAKGAGYLGILSIGCPFNPPDYDEWDIWRGTVGRDLDMWVTPEIHELYHHSAEAFPGRLTPEATRGKWLVDITHIVAGKLPRACGEGLWNRCSTPEILHRRFEEIRDLWGDQTWVAVPEDVVDYTLTRRAATVAVTRTEAAKAVVKVGLEGLREDVQKRELTLVAEVPWATGKVEGLQAKVEGRRVTWTAEVYDGAEFVLTP